MTTFSEPVDAEDGRGDGGSGLDGLEIDALREIMNIGFGQAAAALSEEMGLKVKLSVPEIGVMRAGMIHDLFSAKAGAEGSFSLVEQYFYGRFDGTAFLLVPDRQAEDRSTATGERGGAPRGDFLIEIGSLVIGTCVGKIVALMNDRAGFLAPRYYEAPVQASVLARDLGRDARFALVFTTLFSFEKADLSCYLILVASERALSYAKSAAGAYIRSQG